MASTKADNNRVAWTYTQNNGTTDYRVSAKAVYVGDGTDGAKYGGSAAAGTVAPLPKGAKMRKVKCTTSGGKAIWIVAYEPDATLVTSGTTVTRNINGTDTLVTSTGTVRAESFRSGITDQS